MGEEKPQNCNIVLVLFSFVFATFKVYARQVVFLGKFSSFFCFCFFFFVNFLYVWLLVGVFIIQHCDTYSCLLSMNDGSNVFLWPTARRNSISFGHYKEIINDVEFLMERWKARAILTNLTSKMAQRKRKNGKLYI